MFKEPPFLGGDFVGKSKGFEIITASHYGMCFGVRDAITPAEKRAKSAELTILGELVHNEVVREKCVLWGFGKVTCLELVPPPGRCW